MPNLTPKQMEAFGHELDAIRAGVVADLGQRDADYIDKVIRAQRGLEVAGRGLLFLSFIPPAWIAGTAALSLSKVLDNMEIGHNVMHGQYDWTGDPRLNGKSFEWDTACPADQWRHSHNYMHHTYTNIVGKDRDIGYGILRMSEQEPWRPYCLGNPLYAALLAIFFQYGVALHDLETERIAAGEMTLGEKRDAQGIRSRSSSSRARRTSAASSGSSSARCATSRARSAAGRPTSLRSAPPRGAHRRTPTPAPSPGRFVAYLDETALSLCVEALCDEDLLRVAFVVEGEERLTSFFEMVGAERTERMLAAAQVNGLREEAEHVLGRLDILIRMSLPARARSH